MAYKTAEELTLKITPAECSSFEPQSPIDLPEKGQPGTRAVEFVQTCREAQRLSQRIDSHPNNAMNRQVITPRLRIQRTIPVPRQPEPKITFPIIVEMSDLTIRKAGGSGPRLTAHGGPFMTQIAKPVRASKLARRLIENDPGWAKTNTRLEMLSCYSAVGGKAASQAQVLANLLGRNVVGFPGKVNHLANAEPITFKPQKGLKAARTKFFNSTLHYLSRVKLEVSRFFRGLT